MHKKQALRQSAVENATTENIIGWTLSKRKTHKHTHMHTPAIAPHKHGRGVANTVRERIQEKKKKKGFYGLRASC